MFDSPNHIAPSRPITKRRYIYEAFREKVRSGVLPPDSRVSSTDTLAKEFGVSYVTAHAALCDLVQDGFLVRHQGRGTFVAQFPEAKRTQSSFVVVTPVESDVIASNNSAQVFSILNGCSIEAQRTTASLNILAVPTKLEDADINRYLPEIKKYGSAVFMGSQYLDLIERLNAERFPVCVIDPEIPIPGVNHVGFDRPAAISLSINHLIRRGHRRIGFFGSVNSHEGIKRKAYIKTFRQAGLPYEEAWIVDHRSGFGTYQLFKEVISTQKLDAVFIDNYSLAKLLANYAMECGFRIPEDLAILAYGIASSASSDEETLSHMAIPYSAMGREAIALLDQLSKGELHPPVTRELLPSLQIYKSCKSKITAT